MDDAVYLMLLRLAKENKPRSWQELYDVFFNDPKYYIIKSLINNSLQELYDYGYIEKVNNDSIPPSFIISDYGRSCLFIEEHKRNEIKRKDDLQYLLNKSQLSTNIFIGLTFITSIFSLLCQFYMLKIEFKREKREVIQLQKNLSQSQQDILRDSLLLRHDQLLKNLISSSFTKDTAQKKPPKR